jgi:GAF domain-containing protein
MRRRSRASGEPVKTRRSKTATLERRNAPKAVRRRKRSVADANEKIALLERRLNEALERQTATTEVLKIISSSLGDLVPVFNTMLERAIRLCKANHGLVWRFDGEQLHAVAAVGDPRFVEWLRQHNPVQPIPGSAADRIVRGERYVHVADRREEDAYRGDEIFRGLIDTSGARASLSVALRRDETLLGMINVYRQEMRPFSENQVALLQNFAAQAVIAIENTRLLSELRESLQQQTATSNVLKVISRSTFDLQTVLDTLTESATRLCAVDQGVIFLRDGDVLRLRASFGFPPEAVEYALAHPILPNRGSATGRVALEGKPVHIYDVLADPEYSISEYQRMFGYRTLLSVPLLREGTTIGVFSLTRDVVEPFSDKQIELATTFADQAVIAIENTRLLSELRESLQQQTATADVLKIISRSTFDLQTVLNTLTESAARLCEADKGAIMMRDGDVYRIRANYGFSDEAVHYALNNPLQPDRGSATGRAALEGRAINIPDALTDPEYRAAGYHKVFGYRSMLAIPLLREGTTIGTFTLTRDEVNPFTEKQKELATTFADQAVIAIENVRLFEAEQQRTRELSESLEQQTATTGVLKIISSSPGQLVPVFDAILENAVRICGAKFGSLVLFEGNAYRRVALHNGPAAYVEARAREPVRPLAASPTLSRVAMTKQVVQVADMITEQPEEGIARLAGARTVLCAPMLNDDRVVGVISIYRQEVLPFPDKQIELVTNFAAQAVIAIENARLLNELRESLQQQTATSEVLSVISSSVTDAQPVFEFIARSAARLCNARFCHVFRFDGKLIHFAATHGYEGEAIEAIKRAYPIPPGRDSAVARAILSGTVEQIPDIEADPDYAHGDTARIVNYRSIVAVPMLKTGRPIGAIAIAQPQTGYFPERQLELLRTFADQAVIAIENARLFDEVQMRTRDLSESLQQQTATADVLKVISRSTFDLQTVLDALIESATHLCNADQGSITREIDRAFFRAASYGYSSELSDFIRNTPVQMDRSSIAGRALVEGRIIHVADIKSDPEYTFSTALELGEFRTAIGVPMMREGLPIGVLALTRKEVRPFTDKQIELVTTFADQAAIAIENVRLFESVETRTRDLAKSLEDLRTAQDRLVQTEKLASLGQLTAGIAHEIKNPLNFVNNFSAISTEMIDELRDTLRGITIDHKARTEIDALTKTLQGNLEKVVQHGKRADAIVKNMLLHARSGSGDHRLVDINSVVEESLNLAYHGARAEKPGFNISLKQSFDPTAGQVDIFPQEITRVLLNLISNGFYAATKRREQTNGGDYEPTLAAATKNLGDRVEIRIRDNGTGIPPEVKEKLFNPFFTTKPAGEGTGLGLSISHDIVVKQHGGSIEVDTQPGQFTEIRVILPRAAASLPERP